MLEDKLSYTALNKQMRSKEITFSPMDNRRLMSLCGRFDEHIRLIESRLNVEINNRGNNFTLLGNKNEIDLASNLLNKLYRETERGEELTPAKVHLLLQEIDPEQNLSKKPSNHHAQDLMDEPVLPSKRGLIKPRSKNQRFYLQNILSNDITFGIGPAGTGKTFLAVASAVHALETEKVQRIILVRPAVEAGERLGFLPGDLSQKIDPYLRPLYDALYETMGFERVHKLIERGVIELAPLAYMRGRTLNDAFIILDEGQNTTYEQMKMFLTRIGYGSLAVITGDITQIDLPKGGRSGLKQIIDVLKQIPGISFTFFDNKDVVARHALVQRIVEAYERHEDNKNEGG